MAQDAFRNMIIKRVIVHQVFRRDTDNKVRNPFLVLNVLLFQMILTQK